MNHSCSPNVGSPREAFTLRALRDIEVEEEIVYDYEVDYRFWPYRPTRAFRCRCGSRTCRTVIRY
jgi:SET domain-containing protein